MYKTGEEAPFTDEYEFAGFVDNNVDCEPSAEEETIDLDKGDEFPPISSCDEAAYWRRS